MKFANVRELKNKTSEMIRTAARGNDVLITSHGRPVAVLHGIDDEDMENLVFLRHRGLRKSLEDAEAEYKKKGGVPLRVMMARMEKRHAKA